MNELSFVSDLMPSRRVSALMCIDRHASGVADALESLFAQTIPPDQLILLLDEDISHEQLAAVERYRSDPRIAQVETVASDTKKCFAEAMNAGLKHCVGEWIMYTYANGINHPDRLAIQLDYAARYPDIDLFATWAEEFDDNGNRAIKASAIHHSAVVASLKWRNVLVNSSILIRASVLQHIGGYRTRFSRLESYDLFVRLAITGSRFRIIPAELVRVHMRHRADLLHLWTDARFRVFCWRAGFLTARQLCIVTLAHFVFELASIPTRGGLYRLVRVKAKTATQVRWLAVRHIEPLVPGAEQPASDETIA